MPEPTAAPAALTGVEVLKADSNYLRDPLVAEFAAGGARISEDGYQILKFHGSYQQDDRDVRNDRRKAKEEFDYSFMIRLRLPGGDVHPELWRGLDELAGEFGRDALRLTTRQSIQLHFIPKAELRTVIRGVNERLASTLGACGDVNRNVMAAPLPAADARYAAVREAGRAISNHLLPRCRAYAELWLDGTEVAKVGPPDAEPLEDEPLYGRTYLPRKFKTCVTVAGDNSVDLFTHDLGVAGIFDGERLLGWNVYVGGGLGRTHRKAETFPRLAEPLGFVEPDDLLPIAAAVVTVQRDNGDRTNRRHARLKYTIADRGIDWFRAEVEKVLGFELEPVRPVEWQRFDDRIGWRPQGDGRWFLGLRIENGRVRDDGDRRIRTALRRIADEQGVHFRITPNQNLYLVDVAPEQRGPIDAILAESGLEAGDESALGLRRASMACPALPTCGLAISEAERVLPSVLDDLQALFDEAGVSDTPTVRMTGCPNGCARPYVAEIGFVGDAVDRYQVWLGGDGVGTRIAVPVADRLPRAEIGDYFRPIVQRFAAERETGEAFGDFVVRSGLAVPPAAPATSARPAAAPATDAATEPTEVPA